MRLKTNRPKTEGRAEGCHKIILFILFILSNVPLVFSAQSSSRSGNFVVFAPDQQSADFASMDAEQILANFNQFFELSPQDVASPIILVIGPPRLGAMGDQGTVRVFPQEGLPKIQVNWDETPAPMASFHRGWVRALCVRQAIAAMEPAVRAGGELRIPFWITEGVALQLSGLEAEVSARATLLARLEPELSLDDVFFELEDKSKLNANERSLAFVLCRALLRDSGAKKRFFGELNWPEGRRPMEWIGKEGGMEDARSWWKGIWKAQADQFSWRKLGYGSALGCILQLEKTSTSWMTVPFLFAGKVESPPFSRENIASVAHPWFRNWFDEGNRYSKGPQHAREEGEARRKLSLKWFAQFGPDSQGMTPSDYLSWGAWERDRAPTPEVDGPVEDWFEALDSPHAR